MTAIGWVFFAAPFLATACAYVGYPFLLWLITRDKDALRTRSRRMADDQHRRSAYNEEGKSAARFRLCSARTIRSTAARFSYCPTPRATEPVTRSSPATPIAVSADADAGSRRKDGGRKRGSRGARRDRHQYRRRGAPSADRRAPPWSRPWSTRRSAWPPRATSSVSNLDTASNDRGAIASAMDAPRDRETHAGGIVGASGSSCTIRRELHIQIPDMLSGSFSAALTARTDSASARSRWTTPFASCRAPVASAQYRRKVLRSARDGYADVPAPPARPDAVRLVRDSGATRFSDGWSPVSAIPGLVGLLLLAPAYPLHGWRSQG